VGDNKKLRPAKLFLPHRSMNQGANYVWIIKGNTKKLSLKHCERNVIFIHIHLSNQRDFLQ
jgi:hypothetical protein